MSCGESAWPAWSQRPGLLVLQATGTPTPKAARGTLAQTAKGTEDSSFRQGLIQQLKGISEGHISSALWGDSRGCSEGGLRRVAQLAPWAAGA